MAAYRRPEQAQHPLCYPSGIKGEISRVSSLDKELQSINDMQIEGEYVFLKDEPPDWFSNTKCP